MYAKTSASKRPGEEVPKNQSLSSSRVDRERNAASASMRSCSGEMCGRRVVLRISAEAAALRVVRSGRRRRTDDGR